MVKERLQDVGVLYSRVRRVLLIKYWPSRLLLIPRPAGHLGRIDVGMWSNS